MTQTMDKQDTEALSNQAVRLLHQDVLDGCLWLVGKDSSYCHTIRGWMKQARQMPNNWWRQHENKSLGWWLTCMGVPGYRAFYRFDEQG